MLEFHPARGSLLIPPHLFQGSGSLWTPLRQHCKMPRDRHLVAEVGHCHDLNWVCVMKRAGWPVGPLIFWAGQNVEMWVWTGTHRLGRDGVGTGRCWDGSCTARTRPSHVHFWGVLTTLQVPAQPFPPSLSPSSFLLRLSWSRVPRQWPSAG